MSRTVVAVVALAVLVASPGVATAVVGVLDDGGQVVSDVTTAASDVEGAEQGAGTTDNGSVDVTTGSQLSTVLATTEDEVGTEVSRSAFESRFEAANESERAALVTERADDLAREAAAVAGASREATEAYENGTLNRSTYARRLATLNARARTLRSDVDHLRKRAATVSPLELVSAGYDEATLDAAAADLDSVTGAGASAVSRRFTGQSTGRVAVATDGAGVTIEAETEDGERSREVRGPGDSDENLTVRASEALETAREALSDREWTHRGTKVHGASGFYTFEFVLASENRTGEAEVRVDGSSGTVVRLEEAVQPRDGTAGEDDAGEEDDADEDDGPPLVLHVTGGEPGPGATVTVQARQGGSPVADATVLVGDERVGTTDADGQINVTLEAGETEIAAERGDARGELAFEFEREDDESDRRLDGLNVSATLDEGAVTVSVTYRGEGVSGVQVSADGARAGPTGSNGTVSFAYDGTSDLELEITRGELEVERTYRIENGALVREEAERERGEGEDDTEGEPEKPNEPGELNISVATGEPAPNATVTLEATVDGSPASGVQVFVDSQRVGATDADGRVDVTLDTGETEITAERGDLEAEIAFEFDEEDDGEEDDSAGDGNGAEDAGNGTDSPGGGDNSEGAGNGDRGGNGNGAGSPGDTPDDSGSGDEESDTEDDGTEE